MVWLKFYQKERELFPEAFKEKVKDKNVQLIVNKLCRHFKLGKIKVSFYGNRVAHAYWWDITFPHNPSFGVICHEIAHIFNRTRGLNNGHNKKLMRTIKRLVNYCKKKNYWREERERHNQVKPESSKLDILKRKLSKSKKQVKQTEKKLKQAKIRVRRLRTALHKHKKRVKYYNRLIQLEQGGMNAK